MLEIVEITLSFLLHGVRGHDDKSFCRGPAFANCPDPTIHVTSPDCGETNATLSREYTADGENLPAGSL